LTALGEKAGDAIAAFLQANSGADDAPLGVLAADPISAVAELKSLTTRLVTHFVETVWYVKQASALMAKQDQLRNSPGGTPAGPGRVDDFRLARNLIVNQLALAMPPTSPTSYPTLWGTNRVKWLGWDANADSTMQRNIGTALAIGAAFDPYTGKSSISPDNVYRLENLGSKVRPPRWPFGPILAARAERGAVLYQQLCVACHVEPDASPPGPSGMLPNWYPDRLYGPAPVGAALVPNDPMRVVGTDPNRALNFAHDMNDRSAGAGLTDGLAILQNLLYVGNQVDAWKAKRWEGDRDERWRATKQYAGRPLAAVWAAAPYLHNDSVPTLHDLLLPAAQRPATFRRGGRDFDPVKIGYVEPAADKTVFVFDTTLSGNHNTGHEYGTNLDGEDRMALLEYLKTR